MHKIKMLFIWLCCVIVAVESGITDRLRNFELLNSRDITGMTMVTRDKRDTSTGYNKPNAIEKLRISIAHREYNLLLTENKDLFAPDFSVSTIKDNGEEVPEPFNQHRFFKGIVQGESQSQVFLHWETSTEVNAKILTWYETFYIEPSSPHLPKSDNYSMIVYKESDVIPDPAKFGGIQHGSDGVPSKHYSEHQHDEVKVSLNHSLHERGKRQAPAGKKNTCGLLLVIDTKFLTEIMGGDTARASNYVVDLVARVNAIYRSTNFGGNEGFGFQIEKIKIHDKYSSDPDHYNYGQRDITIGNDEKQNPVNVLLDAFGRVDKTGNTDYTQYCLAHLFTAYAFSNGVLGLAFIASSSRNTYGGICSNSFYDSSISAQVYLNTGWSSAFNRNREKILTQEAEIVLAHELGHNWGSEHDPDTQTCSPPDSSESGGKYIMYTYSVNGFEPNNKRFSECSRLTIGRVLDQKSTLCFTEMASTTKGNFQRDGEEECDSGLQGDKCCTSEQKYTRGSDCSITNDVCCEDCDIRASSGNLCATESDLTCYANSTCNGVSRTCTPQYKEAGDYCQRKYGRCVQVGTSQTTRCRSFPEVIEIDKCTCGDEDDECTLCHYKNGPNCEVFNPADVVNYVVSCPTDEEPNRMCSTKSSIPMKPYNPDTLKSSFDPTRIILAGSTCKRGYCNYKGECERQSTDIVARFWDFLTHLDSNAVVEFMRSNIVGTVAVFSFLLWLPCVILVYCYDRRQAKTEKLENRAFHSMRRHPADDRRLVSRPMMH